MASLTSPPSQTPPCRFPAAGSSGVTPRLFQVHRGQVGWFVDLHGHSDRGLSLDYVSCRQIRPLVPPFPPMGTVAAPFGSPAVPHLHRYCGFVRLLVHIRVRLWSPLAITLPLW